MDKHKKATINPINKKDNKCFQYAIPVVLNHVEIGKDVERIAKIQSFINKYKWKRMKKKKNDWKAVAKNNVTIALNVLKKEKIYPAYVSKHNSNREQQVILLMSPNETR